MINKLNKKGLGPLVIPIVLGILLVGGILLGGTFSSTLSNIPAYVWILIAIILFWLIAKGGKK